uniref:Uncharacterized protein n=1 Tax=Cucumis melo TaxID=3656 RepID=A0A9I9EHV2_CUCME
MKRQKHIDNFLEFLKDSYLQNSKNSGNVFLHQPLPQISTIHQFQGFNVHFNIITVSNLHNVWRRRPLLFRPPFRELQCEKPTMSNKNLPVNTHRYTDPISRTQCELNVTARSVIELISRAPRSQNLRNPLHHQRLLVLNRNLILMNRNRGNLGRDLRSSRVNIRLTSHHFKKGRTRSGFISRRRRRHWVQKPGGQSGVELRKPRRERVMTRSRMTIKRSTGRRRREIHYRRKSSRRKPYPESRR